MWPPTFVVRIGLDHHRHRVPAHDALDAPLDVAVAGIWRLLLRRNRVDVGRRQPGGRARRGAKLVGEFLQQFGGALRPLVFQGQFENRLQRFAPLVAVAAGGEASTAGARTVNFFFLNVHCVTQFFLRTKSAQTIKPNLAPDASKIRRHASIST